MKLKKETQEKVHALLTRLSEIIVNEELIWVRPWTKEEFDERNYKTKIEKIQKDNNFTLDEAIESFIVDHYQEEYEEYDMDDYEETIFTIIDLYFKFADSLYKEHGNIFKDITKESLDKVICHGEYTTRDYLYEELFDKLVEYDDNYEGLKALMVA